MNEGNCKTHKDLDVWNLGIDLVEQVYKLTATFPKDELYGLVSQIRRCAVSIPANIAEGAARHSVKEYIRFLYISLGSLSELETHLEIAKRLGFIESVIYTEEIERLRRKLLNFIKHLNGKLS